MMRGMLAEKHLSPLPGLGARDWGHMGQTLLAGFPIGDMPDISPSRILENSLDQSRHVIQTISRSAKCGRPDIGRVARS